MKSQQRRLRGQLGVLVSLMVPLSLVGCSNDFMKSAVRNNSLAMDELAVVQDEAGNYVVGFTSDSNATQVLRTSSGASIMMPPGSLSIPITLTIGAGESLATSELASTLGLSGNNATSAGPSVSFIPSANIEAANPFSLSIPFGSSAGLNLEGASNIDLTRVVVLYRWMVIKDGEVSYELGMLPTKALKFSSSNVTLTTRKFGTFQIALLDKAISEKVAVKSEQPPTTLQNMGSPFEGQWSKCEQNTVSTSAANGTIHNSLLFTSGNIEELGLAPGQNYFKRELLTIGRGSFSFRKSNFEGEKCTGSIVSEYSERGTFAAKLGNDDFYDTDIVVQDRNMTLRKHSAVVRANATPQNACGISNWTRGEPRSFMNEGDCVTEMQSKTELSVKLKVDKSKLIIDVDEPGSEPFTLKRVKVK